MLEWQILGIDPAPKKDAVVFDGVSFLRHTPQELKSFLEARVTANPATLVAWDAPLSFDHSDFYDRPIDKATREWASRQVKEGRFGEGAINARPFAGLPHWAVSCAVLGMPFGTCLRGLSLAPSRAAFGKAAFLAIEVHPAVAIGTWWLSTGQVEPLPRYKGKSAACARIAAALGLPSECGSDDDCLDAFVAHRLGRDFIKGRATWAGSPERGGYVLPNGEAATEIRTRAKADAPR